MNPPSKPQQIPPTFPTLTTVWLTLQSLPLLLFPSLIVSLLPTTNTNTPTTKPTQLTLYLSRNYGLTLFALSLLAFFTPSSYTNIPFTIFHITTFIYIYTVYLTLENALPTYTPNGLVPADPNTTGLILGLIGYGFLSLVGIWVLVFGDAPARVSKRTGADKRTSGWPFKNAGAYEKRKDKRMGGAASSTGIEMDDLQSKPR